MPRTCAAVLVSLLAAAPAWGQSIGTAPLTTGGSAAPAAAAAATAEAPPMPTFGSLFTDLKHDGLLHTFRVESDRCARFVQSECAEILGVGDEILGFPPQTDPPPSKDPVNGHLRS